MTTNGRKQDASWGTSRLAATAQARVAASSHQHLAKIVPERSEDDVDARAQTSLTRRGIQHLCCQERIRPETKKLNDFYAGACARTREADIDSCARTSIDQLAFSGIRLVSGRGRAL
jgi:hypothetical protein